MGRSVSSAFFEELQTDNPDIVDLIELGFPNETLRWTTSNHPIVSSTYLYSPFPGGASGGGVEESIDLGISIMNFIVANSEGFFDKYIKSRVLSMASIKVDRIIASSPDLDRMNRYWGRIGDLSHNRLAIQGQARNVFDGIVKEWPYYTYTDQCQWKFGGPGCAFDASSIEFQATIESSSLNGVVIGVASGTITSSGYVDDFFKVGKVTFASGVNSGYFRMIREQAGDLFQLTHRVPWAPASGDLVNIRHGCRKRFEADCTSIFNNTSNYLGFQWIPKQEGAF